MADKKLNKYSEYLLNAIRKEKRIYSEKVTSVNPLVAELASLYEKLRNAIEYRDEEVILRASIERILRRRLMFGGNGKSVAASLFRELVWMRYVREIDEEEKSIRDVEKIIDFYLELGKSILDEYKNEFQERKIHNLMFHFMSAEIERSLNPLKEKDMMSNFIFHLLRENIVVKEKDEQIRDIQVFIAIGRAYAKDDLAFLEYKLFNQYFGLMLKKDIKQIVEKFAVAYETIQSQLSYPEKYRILSYVKRQIPPFLILEQILFDERIDFKKLISNDDNFKELIFETCQQKYNQIMSKVRRAIIRSVMFVLLSKVFFAISIEGSYDRYVYGRIEWFSISLNIIIPTLLMIMSGFAIAIPDEQNSERIFSRINKILFDEKPSFGRPLQLDKKSVYESTFITPFFSILWLLTILGVFSFIVYILTLLGFNIMSQAVFIFFVAIVSYLTYRISSTANLYTVDDNQSLITPIVDFLLMPVVRVGRHLTEGISQINILIFVLDVLIETPFKGIVAFFDDWFSFLHAKREEIG